MNEEEIRQLAEEHWEWLRAILLVIVGKVYIDAFLHGYKHGKEEDKTKCK